MKFKVLKPFFKVSEQKNYEVDDTADFTKEEAEGMLNDGYLEEVKAKKENLTFEISGAKLKAVLENTNKPNRNK
jgi:hypothetical protein